MKGTGLELVSEHAMKGTEWCAGDLNCMQLASPRSTFVSEMKQAVRRHLAVSTPVGNWTVSLPVHCSIKDVMVAGSVYCPLRMYLLDEFSYLSPRHASRRQ